MGLKQRKEVKHDQKHYGRNRTIVGLKPEVFRQFGRETVRGRNRTIVGLKRRLCNSQEAFGSCRNRTIVGLKRGIVNVQWQEGLSRNRTIVGLKR